MKRERDDTEEEAPEAGSAEVPGDAPEASARGAASDPAPDGAEEEDDDDLEQFSAATTSSKAVRRGAECPYLDTISRQNLDFDFEKCCSISLSPINVYVCLVCGKYFQGRGPSTHAYTHSLDASHHMFMRTEDGRVFCLPDGYEVVDRSLRDIQFLLRPSYSPEAIRALDASQAWARARDGSEYMPGLVGLNDMRAHSYANVAVQLLNRIAPVRDFFLRPENYAHCRSPLVARFGELVRKLWVPSAFKGHISPHEFMQAVMRASDRRYTIDTPSDAVEFFAWLVNALHAALLRDAPSTGGERSAGGGKNATGANGVGRTATGAVAAAPTGAGMTRAASTNGSGGSRSSGAGGDSDASRRKKKRGAGPGGSTRGLPRTVLSDCLRGEVLVAELAPPPRPADDPDDDDPAAAAAIAGAGSRAPSSSSAAPPPSPPPPRRVPFFQLGLDLPPAPLYKDAMERITIPQVPIARLLAKFDGTTQTSDAHGVPRTYRLASAPRFLVLHVKRFVKNQYFAEKNPTIVTFPTKGLDLRAAGVTIADEDVPGRDPAPILYDIIANVVHEGKVGGGDYLAHILRASEDAWYEVQDLRVTEILPQMVALSETYIQIYERRDAQKGDGKKP